MFQSISFTFLCALAFLSWTVLCYFNLVEEKKISEDYNIEIYTERSHFGEAPQLCTVKSTHTIFFSRIYELLVSYGLVLLTTVVLSKSLQFLERETVSYLQRQSANLALETPRLSIEEVQHETKSLGLAKELELTPPYLQHNWELREQLDDLQARCQELLLELRAINSSSTAISNDNDNELDSTSKSSFSGSDLSISSDSVHCDGENSGMILWKQPAELKLSGLPVFQTHAEIAAAPSLPQNVYVTHSHIHINFNGSVKLSQQNINIASLRLKNMAKSSEFRQVWGKCLKGPNEIPMLTGIHNILM